MVADTKEEAFQPRSLSINVEETGTNEESISDMTKAGLKMIVNATRFGSQLPSGAARDLYSALPSYVRVIENQSSKILNIVQDIMKNENIRGNITRRDDDEKIEMLLECNDIMLESINSNLDEVAGIKKVPDDVVLVESEFRPAESRGELSGSWNVGQKKAIMLKSAKLLTAKNIMRPQTNFKVPVDNANAPFEPRLKDKPNSIKPLAILAEYDEDGNVEGFLHPYEFELNKFEASMELLCKVEVEPCRPLAETPFTVVVNKTQLKDMLEELRKVKEIAVDLEHHSYRTFQGITCLLQVSTRHRDYVIDTIALREELHLLNEVFTDPRIVKVFHGADSDIEWLQRDLSLYVVNMFDTHQAAKRLNFARLSLAFLLKHFCNIDADKTFQLADWRIRPLPEELLRYAQQDTHYLLYIYDMMRNELLKMGNGESHLLKTVYQAGVEICKKRYLKPRLFPDSHLDLYRRSKKVFDNRQLFALKELYKWRDGVARLEDESCGYVLPNHMLMHIAEHLPREMQGVLACCNPVPPLMRQNLHHLHQIMLKAREQPLVTKLTAEQANRTAATHAGTPINQFLYFPHDLTHESDFRDDLPTLLGNSAVTKSGPDSSLVKRPYSLVNLLQSDEEDSDREENKKMAKLDDIKFITPYSRFLSILPVAEEQERLAMLRAAEEAKQKQLCPTEAEMEKREEPKQLQSLKRKALEECDEQGTSQEPEGPPKKKTIKEKVQSFKDMIIGGQSKTPPPPVPKPEKLKKKQKWRAKQNRFDSPQEGGNSSQSNDFDYSNVDYSKFQGGSKQQQKGGKHQQQFESKFRGRGQKAKNADKKFNKMFSFSRLNSNKK